MKQKIKKTISEREFKSALLVISAKLLENKATKCEVVDEMYKDYTFDIDIQIKRLFNMKTGKNIIINNKVVEND